MEIPENFRKNSLKVTTAFLTLAIGLAAGYGLSTVVVAEESKDTGKYCQDVEEGLRKQYNQSTIMCHKPGWVALSSIADEVENQTEVRCVCTRVREGQLELFPIRAATAN